MKAYFSLVLTLVCVSLNAGDELVFKVSSTYKGRQYEFRVTDSQINKTPEWKESRENPPLSPRKAVSSARRRLSKLVQDAKDWEVDKLSLESVGKKGMWIYIVELRPPFPPGGLEGVLPSLKIVVLMDGESIEPTVSTVQK
jgi:hypothetical protein